MARRTNSRSLRSSLLRTVIPVLLLYSGVVMACALILPWYHALSLGKSLAISSTRVAKTTLGSLALENEEQFKYIDASASDEALSEILNDHETFVMLRNHVPFRIFPRTEWTKARFFGEISDSGYVRIGNQLAYATDHSIRGSKLGRMILIRYLDGSVADRIAEVTGYEAAIFAGDSPSASSWRDLSGARVLPVLDEPTQAYLRGQGPTALPIPQIATYRVPHYRGSDPGLRGFYKGRSKISVFQWFQPIPGPEDRVTGFVSVAVPEDLVMGASKRALMGTVLLLTLLCLAAIYRSARYSERLVSPLTSVTNELKMLADQIRRTHSDRSVPEGSGVATDSENEIEILKSALQAFKCELETAERLSAEIEEQRARALAAAKLAELGRIATGIMHEINTPLTVINCRTSELLGLAELPAERELRVEDRELHQAAVRRIAESIEDSVMRISTIANGVKAFARQPRDYHEDWVATPFRSLFNGVLDFYMERFKQKGWRLSLDWRAGDPRVHASPVQIGQVIVNLLNNAEDAIAEARGPKWIEIEAWVSDESACFSVTDSGPGIPPNLRAAIMNPFFTTKAVGKGTGLGLSVSKSIIEEHHGHIALDESCPNTRFVVSIPLHIEAELQVSTAQVSDNSQTFS